MTPTDLEAHLKLITQAAPGLREAGVTSVSVGETKFEIAPFEPALVDATNDPTTTPDKPDDPMKDPELFGGKVPRRRGTPKPTDEDDDPWPSQTDGGKPPRAKRTS